jgi:trk system potassium uptake protein TrkA
MNKFAVIGLGRFGSRLAANIAKAGREVIAIDINRHLIDQISGKVTHAVALDATDEQALREHGVDHVDVAVVGIGNNFESIVLATAVLKQLGVKRVVSRAASHTTAQILTRIGADEVVNPEDESADRWAERLVHPEFLEQFRFTEGHSIVEVKTPASWVGKTLAELNVRAKLGVLVIAVKVPQDGDVKPGRPVSLLSPDEPLSEEQILVLAGADDKLEKLPK